MAQRGPRADETKGPAAVRYLNDITESIHTFNQLVALRSEVTTDREMAKLTLALEEPYEEFQAIRAPSCAAAEAQAIESGMEGVILAFGDYALGEIGQFEAEDAIDSGLLRMQCAFRSIGRMAGEE